MLASSVLFFNACTKEENPKPKEEVQAPTISSFSPESGDPGTIVTITGENFSTTASENVVSFNNVTAEVVEATDTELKVVVPEAATDGKITVTVNENTAASETEFIVNPASFLLTTTSNDLLTCWEEASIQDAQGNTYVAGYIEEGTATFGSTTLIAASTNAFVAMYNDKDGFVWASQVKTAHSSHITSLALDADGNLYAAGYFYGTALFDGISLSPTGGYAYDDAFIAKYNASGQAVWAKQAGGEGADRAYGLAITSAGNILVTGQFRYEALFGDITVTGDESIDAFIASCDSDGNFTKVSRLSGTDHVIGQHLVLDEAENLYLAGEFYGTMSVDGKELTSAGTSDIFVVKYTGHGAEIDWAKRTGGTGYDRPGSITVDASGNLYLAKNGSRSAMEKYTAAGQSDWEEDFGSNNDIWINHITLDGTGGLYATGEVYNSVTLGTTTLSLSGGSDAFVVKQDASSGDIVWAVQTVSPVSAYAGGGTINTSPSGHIYLSGYFQNTTTFGQYTATTEGNMGMFFWKFRP